MSNHFYTPGFKSWGILKEIKATSQHIEFFNILKRYLSQEGEGIIQMIYLFFCDKKKNYYEFTSVIRGILINMLK